MTVYRGVPLTALPRKYGTISMDCPWGFETYQRKLLLPQRTAEQHYPVMTLDELKALPVPAICAKDVVVHMWVISSHIDQCIELGQSWGLKLKSLGQVWVKTQKSNPEKPKMGMGKWFRQEAEISLLFTRGKPARTDAGVRQVILEPKREHSRKPDILDRLERLSGGPYLEMFSRTDREGWDSWGNQAGMFSDRLAELPTTAAAMIAALVDPDEEDFMELV